MVAEAVSSVHCHRECKFYSEEQRDGCIFKTVRRQGDKRVKKKKRNLFLPLLRRRRDVQYMAASDSNMQQTCSVPVWKCLEASACPWQGVTSGCSCLSVVGSIWPLRGQGATVGVSGALSREALCAEQVMRDWIKKNLLFVSGKKIKVRRQFNTLGKVVPHLFICLPVFPKERFLLGCLEQNPAFCFQSNLSLSDKMPPVEHV